MKKIRIIAYIVIAILMIYILGPQFPRPELSSDLPAIKEPVDSFVVEMERKVPVKPDNEAKIIRVDSLPTAYALCYLHGFSASRKEGSPINEDFAHTFHCNTYLARLACHGLNVQEPLRDMTPDTLYETAKQALMISRSLGKKVILMGTSTGGTLALKLAADFPNLVDALILYSPNIQIKQKASSLLSKPWGLQLARINFGGNYRISKDDPQSESCKYWYCRYRAEGAVYLQQLIDATMNRETFKKVSCPVFMGYYYKDELQQDQTIEVRAALEMMQQISTPADKKVSTPFPEAGAHVIGSSITSKSFKEVEKATFDFARNVLLMKEKE